MYAHNDRIAPGAYQAAKKVGREKEMIFVGIDALPGKGNGLEMVLDSVLNATFIYPTNGDKVMQLAMNILEKKPYPRETVMNTAVVDRTNAHVCGTTSDNSLSRNGSKIEKTDVSADISPEFTAGGDVWWFGYSSIGGRFIIGGL